MNKKGKYNCIDVAEYIYWFCEEELKTPVNNYHMQCILIYSMAMYHIRFNKHLVYEDYDLECWTYSFIISELYFNFSLVSESNGYNVVKGIQYPNSNIYKPMSDNDKNFINQMCEKLINIELKQLQSNMVNMKSYEDNYLPLYRDEEGLCVAQTVTIEEIARDLKKIIKPTVREKISELYKNNYFINHNCIGRVQLIKGFDLIRIRHYKKDGTYEPFLWTGTVGEEVSLNKKFLNKKVIKEEVWFMGEMTLDLFIEWE